MKKQTKKKIEQEIATAIEHILAKHDSHAISKTKKTIKASVKSVVKKFSKTIKVLTEQKEAVKAKRKTVKKTPVKKPAAIKNAKVRYNKPKNAVLSPGSTSATTQPAETYRQGTDSPGRIEGYSQENP